LARLERRVFRYQAPQVLVLSQWGIEWGGLAARELLQERSQLYQALGKVAGSSWIVDTGKEPVFGASLTHLSPTVVDVVHVVRDPRGVAYSCKKQVRSDSEPDFMPRRPAAATAWRWLVTNLMAQIALRRLAHRYVLVRYEDLVAAPEACLMRVAKATGLPLADTRAAVDDLARPPENHHRVAGNPGVRQLRGALRLSLDDEWRAGLPVREQRLVAAMCAVLMAPYGYPWRAPGTRRRRPHT
jgi:transposase